MVMGTANLGKASKAWVQPTKVSGLVTLVH